MAAGNHTCGVRTDRTLWCWGLGSYGELGIGHTSAAEAFPVQVGSTSTWDTVAVGAFTSCATRTDASLWCWGYNALGQVGIGSTKQRIVSPQQVGAGQSWSAVSVGLFHTCATRTDGTLWCWGQNSFGALGNGSTDDGNRPEQVGHARAGRR